jgi:hypothetical protein
MHRATIELATAADEEARSRTAALVHSAQVFESLSARAHTRACVCVCACVCGTWHVVCPCTCARVGEGGGGGCASVRGYVRKGTWSCALYVRACAFVSVRVRGGYVDVPRRMLLTGCAAGRF